MRRCSSETAARGGTRGLTLVTGSSAACSLMSTLPIASGSRGRESCTESPNGGTLRTAHGSQREEASKRG